MPKRLTYKEVIHTLKKLSFEHVRSKGSHQIWKGKDHKGQTRIVAVAPHRYSAVVPSGTLSSIIRQSGYTRQEFLKTSQQ